MALLPSTGLWALKMMSYSIDVDGIGRLLATLAVFLRIERRHAFALVGYNASVSAFAVDLAM